MNCQTSQNQFLALSSGVQYYSAIINVLHEKVALVQCVTSFSTLPREIISRELLWVYGFVSHIIDYDLIFGVKLCESKNYEFSNLDLNYLFLIRSRKKLLQLKVCINWPDIHFLPWNQTKICRERREKATQREDRNVAEGSQSHSQNSFKKNSGAIRSTDTNMVFPFCNTLIFIFTYSPFLRIRVILNSNLNSVVW